MDRPSLHLPGQGNVALLRQCCQALPHSVVDRDAIPEALRFHAPFGIAGNQNFIVVIVENSVLSLPRIKSERNSVSSSEVLATLGIPGLAETCPTGANRESGIGCQGTPRHSSSREVAEYSGIAPVTERSGKSKWVHRRFACSQFVKLSFHEFAGQSIKYCAWARAYYDHKRAEGKGHNAAIRALAYRWIPVIYRCWKDHVPYNEVMHLESLRQKRPTWLASLPDREFSNIED